MEAIEFAIKALWWMVSSIWVGFIEAVQWFQARGQGQHYPFPVARVLVGVVVLIVLLFLCNT